MRMSNAASLKDLQKVHTLEKTIELYQSISLISIRMTRRFGRRYFFKPELTRAVYSMFSCSRVERATSFSIQKLPQPVSLDMRIDKERKLLISCNDIKVHQRQNSKT